MSQETTTIQVNQDSAPCRETSTNSDAIIFLLQTIREANMPHDDKIKIIDALRDYIISL